MSFLYNDYIFIPLIGALVFAIVYFNLDKTVAWLSQKSLGSREYVLKKLDLMFVTTDQKSVTRAMILSSFGLGVLVFFVLWPHFVLGFIMGATVTVLGWSIPKLIVDRLYEKRCTEFTNQMVEALTILANGAKSGLTPYQSMKRVVENMPNPISQEFQAVVQQVDYGAAMEDALVALAARIPKPDVQIFVLSLNLLSETGGNVGETLQTIVETIRERQKVEEKIDALTTRGKTQGMIATATPFVMIVIFYFIDASFIMPLFTSTLGLIFFIAALFFIVLGGFVISRMVKIEV